MKRLSFYITVFLLLVGTATGVKAQAKAGTQQLLSRKVSLEPHQRKEAIQIPDSVILLLTDVRIKIALPLSEEIDGLIPAGTKIFVPAGRYALENPSDIPLEFLLISATETQIASRAP